ncbi:MAG: AMP-binding protein [Elusimicrobiota bacterium]|jgi:acetyl-CoA synthetase|nr:AMP-binding protein [Elusimicrobiota bacterium]
MLAEKYTKIDFLSYQDFIENCCITVPNNFNFAFDVVDELAKISPNKNAIIWTNPKGEEQIFTFKDVSCESSKAANFFISRGVKKGNSVMLILKRRYEYWFCALALHKIGALLIPANHLLTVKDVKYRIRVANIKVIVAVADKRITDIVEVAKEECSQLKTLVCINGNLQGWVNYSQEIKNCESVFKRPSNSAANVCDDLLLMYFTSGTTGMPKMVCHDHSYPLGHIITARFWQNLDDTSIHLTVADTGWAKASWGKIYGQWLCGACVFVYDYERFHADEMLKQIVKHKITSFCAPPTVYRHLIKEDLSKYDFSNLKHVQTAGEPLNPEVANQFKKITGLEIMEGFGQTETVALAAVFPWLKVKHGSMGKPSAGWNVDVVDESNNPCKPGQEGRLIVRTEKVKPVGLFCRYYKNEDMTETVWKNGIYDTGDVVYKDDDGYFYFVGRCDDIIKSSGYRIGPFEVESALLEHSSVLECAVTGVADAEKGMVVKATIVLAKGYAGSEELTKELQYHVKNVTAPYKYPRIIEYVKELPKTLSGKIKRKEIAEKDAKK